MVLAPAAEVALRVRNAQAPVTLAVPTGLLVGSPTRLLLTGPEAEFPFPPGTFTLELSSGDLRASQEVTAAPGQRVAVDVTLTPADAGR